MKKIWAILCFLLLQFHLHAQMDSLHFSDPKDAADFEQFQKLKMATMVDSLNSKEMYEEEFYTLNDEGQIELDELTTVGMIQFQTPLERNYYYWLKKKLYNAYPYYIKAIRNYENIQDSLVLFEHNRKMRKYLKKRQKQLADTYESELRELTQTEGQILSKLMYRRTQKTTYEIIGELRGTLNAYVWEAKAGFFDISLKKEFDPINVREDFFLDNIIRRGISRGELEHEDAE